MNSTCPSCVQSARSSMAKKLVQKLFCMANEEHGSGQTSWKWIWFALYMEDCFHSRARSLSPDGTNTYLSALQMCIWFPREVASTVLCCTLPGYNGNFSNLQLYASLDLRALSLYLPMSLRMIALVAQHTITNSTTQPVLSENKLFGHMFGGGLFGMSAFAYLFPQMVCLHTQMLCLLR